MQTLEEADGSSAMAEQTTLQQAGQQDDRRRQTHELILQAKLQDVQVRGFSWFKSFHIDHSLAHWKILSR